MMMALKSLILYLLSSTSGSPDPGEPPPLFGEKTADPKNVTSVRDDGDIVHVTEAPAEEAASNLTTAAEVEASNVTESIESIVLPEVGSAAKEHSASLAVFFLLFVLILSIFLLHLLLKVKFHYIQIFVIIFYVACHLFLNKRNSLTLKFKKQKLNVRRYLPVHNIGKSTWHKLALSI